MKVLVSGSLAYDRIMNFDDHFKNHILPEKVHILNVSFTVDNFSENFGGTAGNIAYNLSLLGFEPVVLATAGDDFTPYKDWLIKNKINVDFIKEFKEEKTSAAYIITDKDDNQITSFFLGALKNSHTPKVDTIINDEEVWAIVAPGKSEDMIHFCKQYQKLDIPYIFDPGQAVPVLSKEDLILGISGAKVFISNDYELELVLNKTGFSLDDIKNRVELLVTTKGPKGSLIYKNKKIYSIPPAKPENDSDPTGAGDAYRAGLIKGLVENQPIEKIGRLAGLISVYTVEKYGTQTHKFDWRKLQKRYKENFNEEL